jgi:diguanylate cyclase (GGDEF)-like protein
VVERNPAGRARRLAGTYANISARKREDERLRRLAEIDPLTDLPNRALFRKRLQQSLLRATPQEPMALFFLDIDHFKAVNDTLGHEAGDHLLQIFARRMRETIRESDMVARLAGDEFTVIVEGLQRAEDAQAVAAKLLAALRDPIALAGNVLVVTASVGVANYKPGESDPAEILRRADAALYEAKRKGRDGYFCEPAASPSIAQIVASNPTGHVIH